MAAVPVLAAALLVSGGCVHASAPGEEQPSTRDLFAAAYEDIQSVYIHDVRLGKVVVTGLDEALRQSNHIQVQRSGGHVALKRGADTLARFEAPRTESPAAWAALTAKVLKAETAQTPAGGPGARARRHERVFASILDQLDRYSRYSGALEARDNRAQRDGFGGIGVRIEPANKGLKVVSVVDGSPAAKVGLHSGATIVAVDGTRLAGLPPAAAIKRLRGPVDESVRVTVERARADRRETLQLARAFVVPRTVSLTMRGNVAHISISGFNRETAESLRAKIRRAAARATPRLHGYVLDLRDNPGGLLDEAVDVADLFLRDGRIVSTHGRHPDSHQYFDASASHMAGNAPVVVLVNGGSASAAEIVAAALQDANRALVVGTASYGKGTIQTVLRLPNAGELTLTWARFHAPSGYALSGRGVIPDVCTSRAVGGAGIVRTLRQGSQPISRAVIQRQVPHTAKARIDALRAHCPARSATRHVDLAVALKLLRNRALYRRAAGERPALLARRR